MSSPQKLAGRSSNDELGDINCASTVARIRRHLSDIRRRQLPDLRNILEDRFQSLREGAPFFDLDPILSRSSPYFFDLLGMIENRDEPAFQFIHLPDVADRDAVVAVDQLVGIGELPN